MWWRRGIAALVLILGSSPLPASTQTLIPLVSDAETRLRVDWTVVEDRGQRVATGYVFNKGGQLVRRVRVLVDALDGGRVVGQRLQWVSPDITPGARSYFTVPVPAPAAAYRVSVFDYDVHFGITSAPGLDATRAVVLQGLAAP